MDASSKLLARRAGGPARPVALSPPGRASPAGLPQWHTADRASLEQALGEQQDAHPLAPAPALRSSRWASSAIALGPSLTPLVQRRRGHAQLLRRLHYRPACLL